MFIIATFLLSAFSESCPWNLSWKLNVSFMAAWMRIVLCELGCLNTSFPVGGAVWGAVRAALLEEVHPWRWPVWVHCLTQLPVRSLCFVWLKMWPPSFQLRPACLLLATRCSAKNSLIFKLVLVMVFDHSNREKIVLFLTAFPLSLASFLSSHWYYFPKFLQSRLQMTFCPSEFHSSSFSLHCYPSYVSWSLLLQGI